MNDQVGVFLAGPGAHLTRQSLLGKVAPEFQAKDEDGNAVSLRRLLRTGPLLLHFYRGHW